MSEWLDLVVSEVDAIAPQIVSIQLSSADGRALPSWQAGAHVKVALPDGDVRSYSLISLSSHPAATHNPSSYRIAVRLDEAGKGGSRFMHGLKVGESLRVSPPANNFPLGTSRRRVVLVAGGIGITPIASMLSELAGRGQEFAAVYAARSQAHLAFLTELSALAGERLSVHADDQAGILDLGAIMRGMADGEELYLCGPLAMIDAAVAMASEFGWKPGRLHFEIFSAAQPRVADQSFEVVLASSKQAFVVPPDKTILDVLIEAGVDPLYDCRRGDCGICQVSVVEGVPDHRDYILTETERAAGKLMQICVSRSKTPRLVLDL